ncbi:MAG: hypothetical protein LAT67_09915 [Balneolales bacterium]|nr:hypothetical protein [Balneolales bacterium]
MRSQYLSTFLVLLFSVLLIGIYSEAFATVYETDADTDTDGEITNSLTLKPSQRFLSQDDDFTTYLRMSQLRLEQERQAMLILLGWGSLNLLAGSLMAANGYKRDFNLMNAGWGAVNAGIAAFALISADTFSASASFEEVLRDEMFFNRILAVNSGLNAGYIASGFLMNYLGSSSRIRQFGSSVMVQGAFLMGFDAWLLWNSSSRLRELAAFPTSILSFDQNGDLTQTLAITLSFGF